jgi:hypothetical protein
MQWSDAVRPPSERTLRQFAILWLIVLGSIAGWRAWSGAIDSLTLLIGILSITVGVAGMARPSSVRWIYSGWMVMAFPIGWTITQILLGVLYFGLFTPIALVFRLVGRDALSIERRPTASYWRTKPPSASTADYLREY